MRANINDLSRLPPMILFIAWGTFASGFVTPRFCYADTSQADALELFEKHVRPTLVEHCVRCHGPEKQQGGLRLDTREGWAAGGDSGPAIVPGEPDGLLLRAIGYENPALEMPPRGKLPEQTIGAFKTWARLGAIDPRATDGEAGWKVRPNSPTTDEARSFWSFQTILQPAVPETKDATWPETDIDRFILARLEQSGLKPAEDADATVLLRRVYYDLIGLPPTPRQIQEFLSDRSPTAYEDLVDRLLASHHFGERWGRHWLDVVRFAESSGGGRTLLFPHAWRYRDYIIDALNRDLPYDQFLTQQIAGDLIDCNDWQQKRRNLVATGFLLLGPTNYEMQDKDILEMDVVDEQLDTMGKALLGMTFGCARCHDHKFDPIPAHDYYAMAGILKSTQSLVHSNVSKWNTVGLPLPPAEETVLRTYGERLAETKAELYLTTQRWIDAGGKPDKKNAAKSIDSDSIVGIVLDDSAATLVGKWTDSTSVGRFVGQRYIHDATADKGKKSVVYQGELPADGRYEVLVSYAASSNRSTRVPIHVHHHGGKTIVRVNQRKRPDIGDAFASLGVFKFDSANDPRVVVSNEGTEDGVVIADAVVFVQEASREQPLLRQPAKTDKNRDTALIETLRKEVDQLAAEIKSLERVVSSRPISMATADHERAGDIHLAIRGLVHQQGPVTPRGVMQVASWEPFPEIPEGQSGRKELAQWIVDVRNPLTARVMVNRIWHWLLGRGIVSTVDNFGTMGQPPTHPELLDHLASTLTRQRWSIKRLIREIVRSRVYCLSTSADARSQSADPENRLLWRMNRKRLLAEDIRDSLLLVAGTLDLACGGPNIKPGTKTEYGYQFSSTRRSVYVPVFRNTLPEIFEVFDFADPNIQRGQRTSSTVASQALLLMNHPLVIEQSQHAASRLSEEPLLDTEARVRYAYFQVLGRPPNEQEYLVAVDLVDPKGDNDFQLKRWAMLYQVLFQCIDFRYLD